MEWIIANKMILVVIAVLLPPFCAWLVLQFKRLWATRDSEQWTEVWWAVDTAVKAAEQMGLHNDLAEWGNSKLKYAVDFVEKYLNARNIKIDVQEIYIVIRGMIEAEVFEKINKPTSENGQA